MAWPSTEEHIAKYLYDIKKVTYRYCSVSIWLSFGGVLSSSFIVFSSRTSIYVDEFGEVTILKSRHFTYLETKCARKNGRSGGFGDYM